jgi:transcriptional regulator with XRE-family HTH domain
MADPDMLRSSSTIRELAMPDLEPTVRGRMLGAQLRQCREDAGFTGPEVNAILRIPPDKLSRIESGKRRVLIEDVAALLALYRVTGKRREEILDLARGSDQPNWVQKLQNVPQELRSLVDQESTASVIRNYQALFIPGLLQTPEYTRALMSSFIAVPADQIEARIEARKLRQRLLGQAQRPAIYVIIEESVLSRPTGGPRVMAGQLRWLLHLAARPDIRMRILPHSIGAHSGLDSPFVIMDYADASPIVHLENGTYSLSVDESDLIAKYERIFTRLAEIALDDGESADLVAKLASEYAERSE